MDALFMRPVYKTAWAQITGKPLVLEEIREAPSIDDEKLEAKAMQVEERSKP